MRLFHYFEALEVMKSRVQVSKGVTENCQPHGEAQILSISLSSVTYPSNAMQRPVE